MIKKLLKNLLKPSKSLPPRITVCIPTWQAESFIEQTINYVKNQTYRNIKILISIDNCEDRTREICESEAAKDSRIQVFFQPERLGWAGNCNFLLDQVETEFYCLYFHDDIIEPDYLEKLLKVLDTHPEAMSVHCDMGHFGGNEQISVGYSNVGRVAERLASFCIGLRGSPLRSLTRKIALDKGLRFPTAEKTGFWANQPFLLKLLALGPARHLPEVLYKRWDQREGGLTDSWKKRTLAENLAGFQINAQACIDIINEAVEDSEERLAVIYCLYLFIMLQVRQAEYQWQSQTLVKPESIHPKFAFSAIPKQVELFSTEIRERIQYNTTQLLFIEGKNAFQNQQWSLAKSRLEQVLTFDTHYQPARSFLEKLPKSEDLSNQPKKPAKTVAILGAGMMGSTTALYLARQGIKVVLYDGASEPMAGASRWNEGKIHLGFLYAADSSLKTAQKILPGGLLFQEQLTELLGCSLDNVVTQSDDLYLVHRDSVVTPEAMAEYCQKLLSLIQQASDCHRYFIDLTKAKVERLSQTELEAIADTNTVLAGFRVPERSVNTRWIAERLIESLRAENNIELRLGHWIKQVKPLDDHHQQWQVDSDQGQDGPFDAVVNALWEGRLAIDAKLGILPNSPVTHRYRLSVFARTREPVNFESAVLATGPFGDVKNYNGRDLYLSWYPLGLLMEGNEIEPPPIPTIDLARREEIVEQVIAKLASIMPKLRGLGANLEDVQLGGGWVFAKGQGSLLSPESTLHRRYDIGLESLGTYYSVDTGKYSIAPWLAKQIVGLICGAYSSN